MPLIHQLRDRSLPMTMEEWQMLGRIVAAGDDGHPFSLDNENILVLYSLHHRGFLADPPADKPWVSVASPAGKGRWMYAEGDPETVAWKLRNKGMLD